MKRALRRIADRRHQDDHPLHQKILDHAAFIEHRVDTTFIERTWQDVNNPSQNRNDFA